MGRLRSVLNSSMVEVVEMPTTLRARKLVKLLVDSSHQKYAPCPLTREMVQGNQHSALHLMLRKESARNSSTAEVVETRITLPTRRIAAGRRRRRTKIPEDICNTWNRKTIGITNYSIHRYFNHYPEEQFPLDK